ncbi:lamin tail domain-containing protein [Botrimarina hoheduenensis]|uniref:LTD domain-containing protein n=1 Tax=Botrimarina hoheduenensis TaxID=2528000 RepID=A0A5C5WC60_9BACT|nr:lamin tail domain-containing protein [Botrimarina hoheduenensis]TWT48506.1 hypothetical protein Pla111_02760 [Botrimarina hoheduenensis]
MRYAIVMVCLTMQALPLLSSSGSAQLVVTEIMYDPASDEPAWEWLEVYNPGAAPIDLAGFFVDRVGDPALGTNPAASIRPVVGVNGTAVLNATVVPAHGVAVLYNGEALGYEPQRFRSAWPSVPAGVPLIGVSGWGGNNLTNNPSPPDVAPDLPGLTFGFWPNESSYRADTANLGTAIDPDRRVVRVSSANFSFAYASGAGWPLNSGNGSSIQHNGVGSTTVGANWGPAAIGADNAFQSTQTHLPGAPVNGADRGSPGRLPAGNRPAPRPSGPSLMISEIMANPASITGSREWEWVEIVNYGTQAIDFATTPLWLDDDDGSALNGANVFFGSIPAGGTAVLFDANAATLAQMQSAWNQSVGLNLIPVIAWPTLANSGDTIGLWTDPIGYAIDKIQGTVSGALMSVTYDNISPWPNDNDADSIYLRDLTYPTNVGAAWARSSGSPYPDAKAYRAAAVFDPLGVIDNSGADVGSPGHYGPAIAPLAGDYNNDGQVDSADYTVWRDGGPLANETASPHVVDQADYEAWRVAYQATAPGYAVPEPSFLPLLAVAGGLAASLRW